jgi:carbon storage regulator
MLVVTRKKDEKLMIGDDIEVQILRIGRENVRLGIKAPAEVSIYRHEIYEAIQRREQAAAASPPEAPAEGPATKTDAAAASAEPTPRAKAQTEG